MEETIKEIMKDCLTIRGYDPSDEQLDELVEVYTDCQEWDDNDNMVTGKSYDEIDDFVRHSAEVDRILG